MSRLPCGLVLAVLLDDKDDITNMTVTFDADGYTREGFDRRSKISHAMPGEQFARLKAVAEGQA